MPYAPLPYVQKPYDSSRSDARMADLMRYQGNFEQAATIRAGENRARMIAGVGQNIAGSLGDLVKYRQEAPQRELRARQSAEEMERLDRADRYRALDQSLAGATDEDRAKALEQGGFRDEADAARDRTQRRNISKLQEQASELDIQGKSIKQAGDILGAIKSQKDLGARAAAYAAAVPHLRKLVPYMAQQIPDQFSDEFLDIGSAWGKTEAEKLAEARELALEADAVAKAAKSKGDLVAFWQDYIGKNLGNARDGNDWDDVRMVASRAGAPNDVISLFGDSFSPEAVRHASDLAKAARKSPATASSGTEYERELARYAARLGKDVEDLTQAEENKFKASNAALGRKPDDAAASEIPAGIRSTAVKDRDEALEKLDESDPDYWRAHTRIWRTFYDRTQTPEKDRSNARTTDSAGRDLRPAGPPRPGATAPTARTAPTTKSAPPRYTIGQKVMYQGKLVEIAEVSPDGTKFRPKK